MGTRDMAGMHAAHWQWRACIVPALLRKAVQGLCKVPGDCLRGGSREHNAHPPPILGTAGKRTTPAGRRHRPSIAPSHEMVQVMPLMDH